MPNKNTFISDSELWRVVASRNFDALLSFTPENDKGLPSWPIELGIKESHTKPLSLDDILLLLSLCNSPNIRIKILDYLSCEIKTIQLKEKQKILSKDAGFFEQLSASCVSKWNLLTTPEVFLSKSNLLEQADYLNTIMCKDKCSYREAMLKVFDANLDKIAKVSDASTKTVIENLINKMTAEKKNLTPHSTLQDYNSFRTNCKKLIHESLSNTDKHHDLYQILLNFGLFFAGLGIGYLVVASLKKATTGKFLFFSNKVSSELRKIDSELSLPDLVSKRYSPFVQ